VLKVYGLWIHCRTRIFRLTHVHFFTGDWKTNFNPSYRLG
jgi:hypothetical protein